MADGKELIIYDLIFTIWGNGTLRLRSVQGWSMGNGRWGGIVRLHLLWYKIQIYHPWELATTTLVYIQAGILLILFEF